MTMTPSIQLTYLVLILAAVTNDVICWQIAPPNQLSNRFGKATTLRPQTSLSALKEKKHELDAEETTEKYGLEAGLFESMKKEDGGATAQSLLKKYGVAYLATSIPLAMVSYAICYALVDNGVDVQGLLSNAGIETDFGEKVGTAAIAYAAHKAASPIRFPPTVLMTPVVAKLIGKEPVEENSDA